jgi:hypothetical protein
VLLFASVSGLPDSDAAVTTAQFDHHVGAILAKLVSSDGPAATADARLGVGLAIATRPSRQRKFQADIGEHPRQDR